MEGREGHFKLAKGGARRETDLAVVVLASACSPRSQAALRSTRAIPRSQVACGASTGEITAIWAFFLAVFLIMGPRAGPEERKWCVM